MSSYHVPVMAEKCLEALSLKPGGVYVDATLGGGGHTLQMLKSCPGIKLYCFDRDEEAIGEASRMIGETDNVDLIHANFSTLRTELALRKVKSINGILFDLGVSSHQIDDRERGFSFDRDAALDMRMDKTQDFSAYDVVNSLEFRVLAKLIKDNSDELNASRIAKAIVAARETKPIESTGELARIIEAVVGSGSKDSLKTKVRVFQAIRIYVNGELEILGPALEDAINLLVSGGRIVVMSYHSLEDRIVKNVFRDAATGCKCPPKIMKCVCGETKRLKVITGRPVSANEEELVQNNRARSAKLRVAQKI